jgi:hypothetical protein
MKQYKPTDKQIAALRRFKIAEQDIQQLDFAGASEMLGILINKAKNKKPIVIKIDPYSQKIKPGSNSSSLPPTEPGNTQKVIKLFEEQRFNELNKFNIEKALDESILIVSNRLAISPSDTMVFAKWSNLVAEIFHSKFAMHMSKQIQENKERNLGIIKKS